jgi:aldehyde:ferredoxin oxidoreductase
MVREGSRMAGEFAYAGKILRVDLSSGRTSDVPTEVYARRFLGGRGIACKIYWDEVSPMVGPLDPENRLIFATGPLGGLPAIGGSRWQVCGKSPATDTEQFNYTNLGGGWGAHLKFAGYDAIVVHGKAEGPVYIQIEDGTAHIRDASHLWGRGAMEARGMLKEELGRNIRVVATGIAGENMVSLASLLADDDASGSGGLGAVMGSKNLKAIAVGGGGRVAVANRERLRELTTYFRQLRKGGYDQSPFVQSGPKAKNAACYGCIDHCMRNTYEAKDGQKGKFMCQAALFYQPRALRYYGEWNDVGFHATKLCDEYGLDINALDTMITWLSRCHRAGILTDEGTGIPLSKTGSMEYIEALVKKISLREGFGDILAQGTMKAVDSVGNGARELITDYIHKAGQNGLYGPRMYITNGLMYAMEPRQPIQQVHEIGLLVNKWVDWVQGKEGAYVSSEVFRGIGRRFWGSEIAADFSTYEGKALAAKMIQDRQYAKESLILCDLLWPILEVESSNDHMGDSTLESKLLSAATGWEMDEEGLRRMGEAIFNLQRAILVREGHRGRESDILPEFCYSMPIAVHFTNPSFLAPGEDGEPHSRKGAVVDREKFERMKDEYYQLRDWDVRSGLQTRAKLEELGLGDIVPDLERRGLVV